MSNDLVTGARPTASPMRICFFGDSIVHGTKDPTTLGWPGRLCARAAADGHDLTMYNLGVRGDTSTTLRRRWRSEARRRVSPELHGRLVFSFGLNDALMDERRRWRIAPRQTLANAEAILREATSWLPTLLVGPAPVDDGRLPPQGTDGQTWTSSNPRIRAVNDTLAEVADRAAVPFLDVFAALKADTRWAQALAQSDSIHPAQGYVRIAELVEAWAAWQRWLAGEPHRDEKEGMS
jgi:lysophospholipase L1-like esterase